MTTDARATLADAYRAIDDAGDAKQRRRLAAIYRPNARMERLLRLCSDDPAAFDRLGPTTRMGVGHYQAAKAAHEEEEAAR